MKDLQIKPDCVPKTPHFSILRINSEGARITTADGWKQRRAQIEKIWKTFLGVDNKFATKIPLNLQIALLDNTRSCSRYQLIYNVDGHGHWTVDAYLLVPNAILLKKMPAFVAFHQTTKNDSDHAKEPAGLGTGVQQNMDYGVKLAELGYVVLCPRNFLYPVTASDNQTRKDEWKKKAREVRTCYPRWKGITRMVFDAMRAVDVLQSFAFVDPDRIGCLGHSLGAKEVLYAAAFDDRYKVAVFSEGGIGLESKTNWDAKWYLGSHVKTFKADGHDHHELLALIAPRPFLLLAGGSLEAGTRKGNEVDDEKSWKYIKAAMPVYNLLGKPKNIGWWHHKQGHDYPEEAQVVTREFVLTHLPPP